MNIIFRESVGKAFLCHLQLTNVEVNKKVFDLNECFSDCKKILLACPLSGPSSEVSWEGTKLFLEEGFKELELLLLIERGNKE